MRISSFREVLFYPHRLIPHFHNLPRRQRPLMFLRRLSLWPTCALSNPAAIRLPVRVARSRVS